MMMNFGLCKHFVKDTDDEKKCCEKTNDQLPFPDLPEMSST